MKKFTIAMIALPLAMFSAAVLAGDAAAGKAKAEACMDCHAGEDFEGMSAAEIAARFARPWQGRIKHPPGLDEITEADIDDVAAFFAAEAGGRVNGGTRRPSAVRTLPAAGPCCMRSVPSLYCTTPDHSQRGLTT
jgi:cytochrome c553